MRYLYPTWTLMVDCYNLSESCSRELTTLSPTQHTFCLPHDFQDFVWKAVPTLAQHQRPHGEIIEPLPWHLSSTIEKNKCTLLTLYLLVSSGGILCKQFGPIDQICFVLHKKQRKIHLLLKTLSHYKVLAN